MTKGLLLKLRWWYCVLLLSPFLGIVAAGLHWNSGRFAYLVILTSVGFLAFLPGCIFVVTNVRLLHPLSFGTFLILGAFAGKIGDAALALAHKFRHAGSS